MNFNEAVDDSTKTLVVFSTVPSRAVGQKLARSLVEKHLAACVNVIPGILSIYRWQGQIEESAEELLVIKTTSLLYTKLEAFLLQEHPYETPEILALAADRVSPSYLAWLLS